jgi:hypothetical protein
MSLRPALLGERHLSPQPFVHLCLQALATPLALLFVLPNPSFPELAPSKTTPWCTVTAPYPRHIFGFSYVSRAFATFQNT